MPSFPRKGCLQFVAWTALLFISGSIGAQMVPQAVALAAPPVSESQTIQFTCPGNFPTDLTVINCRYTQRDRLDQFVSTGLTDEAMLLSVSGSLFTQAIHSPGEWPRTWKYYGYRVGSSYTGSVGRASAEYIVGSLMRDDPRHVKCADDPRLFGAPASTAAKPFTCNSRQRFVHFILDSVTVRFSSDGQPIQFTEAGMKVEDIKAFKHSYDRFPAFDRLVGVYAGAYAEYPWQPRSANTFGSVSQRAALSFGSTFLGSFYTEYGASVMNLFKKKSR